MLHYDEYGDVTHPTILLLHGAMAVDTFSQQYDLLKSDYHIVVPHLYGAGVSVEKDYDPFTLEAELLEIIHFINKPKIIVIGHSIGAQLAVLLVAKYPNLFEKAVFLSPWVIPNERSTQLYTSMAPLTVWMLRQGWIVRMQGTYWGYTKEQRHFMASYSKKLSVSNYKAFFEKTIDLNDIPQFFRVEIPMLAVSGSRESKDIKQSVTKLGENPYCQTLLLNKAGHDFPMRKANRLNPIIKQFLNDEFINLQG